MPAEIAGVFDPYFQSQLAYCLNVEESHPQKKVDDEISLLLEMNKTEWSLRTFEIQTPDGRRKMSDRESGELVVFAALSAQSICSQNSGS